MVSLGSSFWSSFQLIQEINLILAITTKHVSFRLVDLDVRTHEQFYCEV